MNSDCLALISGGILTDKLTLSYTAINGIASFTAVAENGRCQNNGILEQLPYTITD